MEERLIQRLAVLNWERDRLYRYLLSSKWKLDKLNLTARSRMQNLLMQSLISRAIEFRNAITTREVEKFISGVRCLPAQNQIVSGEDL